MKVELNEKEKEEIVKRVTRLVEGYVRENATIQMIIAQEVKKYHDNEKKEKARKA